MSTISDPPEAKYLTQVWATRELLMVQQSPDLAAEFYARIVYKLRGGIELSSEERAILADCLDAISQPTPERKKGIERIKRVSADIALHLKARKGRSKKQWSQENLDIVNRVRELLAKDYSQKRAFEEVGSDVHLSRQAVEKIYRFICKSTGLKP